MPYAIYEDGDQYCVHKKDPDGSKGKRVSGGCHGKRSDAEDHMSALYAAEKNLRKAARVMAKIIYG